MTAARSVPLLLLPGLTNDERVWRAVKDLLQGAAQDVAVGHLRVESSEVYFEPLYILQAERKQR